MGVKFERLTSLWKTPLGLAHKPLPLPPPLDFQAPEISLLYGNKGSRIRKNNYTMIFCIKYILLDGMCKILITLYVVR